MTPRKPVGIDLGTTYSAVATLDANGRSTILRNAEGEVLTPSVVLFEDNEIVVGKFAKRAIASHADRVAECVKREMGQQYYSRPLGGQQLPPEVIQACILRKLRRDAGPALGSAGVVITVPAYFDEPRRKATTDAAELAELDVLDIVNEPTAAALAFGEQLGYLTAEGEARQQLTVLVYDLGGGTFDATVITLAPGDIRTLAIDGDVELGGRDFDQRLAEHLSEQFRLSSGVDLRADPLAWNQLMGQAEQAKHTLSSRERAVVHLEHSGRSAELNVSRDEFRQLTENLLDRTSFTTRQVIAAAGLTFGQLDRVLLVGGSTRMPMVADMLRQLTGLTPEKSINPDEAVARGAAIFAGYLLSRQPRAGGVKPAFKVTDVNSHSLGIQGVDPDTKRRENVIVIPRNTPLPAVARREFATQSAGQRSIIVQVLEGETSQVDLCSQIGRSVLRDLPAGLPQNWPVEVVFQYAANGRLDVRASVPGTSRSLLIELERERGLTGPRLHFWKQIFRQGTEASDPAAPQGLDADARLAAALQQAAPMTARPTVPVAPPTAPPPSYPAPPAPASGPAHPSPPTFASPPASFASPPAQPSPPSYLSPPAHSSGAAVSSGLLPPPALPSGHSPGATGVSPGATGVSPVPFDEHWQAAGGTGRNFMEDALEQPPPAQPMLAQPIPIPLPQRRPPAPGESEPAMPQQIETLDGFEPEDTAGPEAWAARAAAPATLESQEEERARRRRRLIFNIVGQAVASTVGLLLGYIILCKIRPDMDFLGFFGK